jgi:hypothetical protein
VGVLPRSHDKNLITSILCNHNTDFLPCPSILHHYSSCTYPCPAVEHQHVTVSRPNPFPQKQAFITTVVVSPTSSVQTYSTTYLHTETHSNHNTSGIHTVSRETHRSALASLFKTQDILNSKPLPHHCVIDRILDSLFGSFFFLAEPRPSTRMPPIADGGSYCCTNDYLECWQSFHLCQKYLPIGLYGCIYSIGTCSVLAGLRAAL